MEVSRGFFPALVSTESALAPRVSNPHYHLNPLDAPHLAFSSGLDSANPWSQEKDLTGTVRGTEVSLVLWGLRGKGPPGRDNQAEEEDVSN